MNKLVKSYLLPLVLLMVFVSLFIKLFYHSHSSKVASGFVLRARELTKELKYDSAIVSYNKAGQVFKKNSIWDEYLKTQFEIGEILFQKNYKEAALIHIYEIAQEAMNLGYYEEGFIAYYQLYMLINSFPNSADDIVKFYKEKVYLSATYLIKSSIRSDYWEDAIEFIFMDIKYNVNSGDYIKIKNSILKLDSLKNVIYKYGLEKYIYEYEFIMGAGRSVLHMQLEKAVDNLEKALSIGTKLKNNNNVVKKMIISYLVEDYAFLGKYEKAEELMTKVQYDNEMDAELFMLLGNTLDEQGKYNEALVSYQKAKEIAYNTDKNQLPIVLYNESFVYKNIGEYLRAEELLLEGLDLFGDKLFSMIGFKESHPIPAIDSINYANILGKELEFMECLLKTDSVNERELTSLLIYISNCYNELGNISLTQNDFEKAKDNYLRSAWCFQRAMKRHYIVGGPMIYGNLGTTANLIELAAILNDTASQKKYFDYYYSFREIDILAEKPDIKTNLLLLEAKYQFQKNNYREAEEKGLKALELSKKYYLKKFEIDIYDFLANLYLQLGQLDNSIEYFEILTIEAKKYISDNFPGLSDMEKYNFISKIKSYINNIYSFSVNHFKQDQSLSILVYNNSLFYNKLILGDIINIRKNILMWEDPNIVKIFNTILSTKSYLSKLYSLEEDQVLNSETEIKELNEKIKHLERKLSYESEKYANATNFNISWEIVQNSLQNDEAVIDFFKVDYFNDKNIKDSTLYYALLLRKDYKYPKILFLFNEEELKGHLKQYSISQLYSTREFKSIEKNSLYNLIWSPIDCLLIDIKKVFISPTGLLHKVSFPAIPISTNSFLCDKYNLDIVNSSRIVTSKTSCKITDGKDLSISIYGGINYDIERSSMQDITTEYLKFKDASDPLINIIAQDRSRNLSWTYLEGTQREASMINSLFTKNKINTYLFTGERATEESIKYFYQAHDNHSPTIIHFSTHGFFFPNSYEAILNKDSLSTDVNLSKKSRKRDIIPLYEPLFRSGLVFAGANRVWKGNNRLEGIDDGILTSYEISNLYLPDTKLVTLSACETGLGDIFDDEGVFGLQRAFKIAGVDYIIMSLWNVSDQETAELMISFYEYWLNGNELKEAFRQAQAKMRIKYEPFYWAAFVLIE